MTKAQQLLQRAREIANTVDAWADLHNALFSPEAGIIARAFTTRAERQAFMKTSEYQQIRELIWAARDRTGLVEGATPTVRKSGKFVVRLPESLHAALEREAQAEGVSLNQLVVTKLAVQLKDAVRPKRRRAG